MTYEGKWKDELSIGKIRNLQYIESRNQWIADVLPMKDIGENVYSAKKGSTTEVFEVKDLKPVRNFYVRSADGYKIFLGKNNLPSLFSDAYNLDGFELPKPEVDSAVWQQSFEQYQALKKQLIKDTLLFGAVGMAISTGIAGWEDGLVFGLGVLSSVLYVVLLGKKADAVGKQSSPDDQLGNARFLLPFLLVGVLALKHAVFHDYTPGSDLQTVPRDQFAAAMLGFLSYRIPLLYREISPIADTKEILSVMPGSVGQAAKLASATKNRNAEIDKSSLKALPVVVVSGPKLLGRTELVSQFLQEDSRFKAPVWVTDKQPEGREVNGTDCVFLDSKTFEQFKEQGAFVSMIQEGEYRRGLRFSDLEAPSEEGRVCLVDAEPSVARSLANADGIGLVAVWVTLDTLEAIESKIDSVLKQAKYDQELKDGYSTKLQTEISGAILDVEFAVKSGIFDFTIINSDEKRAREKLKEAVEYSFRISPKGK